MAKILIADDHVLVRAALARYLSAATGDDIFQANTLPTALNMMAESGPFDLVLLDYTMPGMSLPAGLARAIKANAQQPVALLSGTAPRGGPPRLGGGGLRVCAKNHRARMHDCRHRTNDRGRNLSPR